MFIQVPVYEQAGAPEFRGYFALTLTIQLRDERVLFTRAKVRGQIVVFLRNAPVTVVKKRTGEVRMIATVDRGCRSTGGPKQMG